MLAMSKKYWLIPPSRRVSRKRGSWVRGVQAATTTRLSPFSRIVSAICAAASVEQMKRPSSAWATLSRPFEYSTTEGMSTTRPMFAPQWQAKTPTLISSSDTSRSSGYTLSVSSLPLRDLRSAPARALAPLAVITDSGMSMGPWNAPLTNTPGRVVSMGFTGFVLQKPCSLSSMPNCSARCFTSAGGPSPTPSTTRSNSSSFTPSLSVAYRIVTLFVSGISRPIST